MKRAARMVQFVAFVLAGSLGVAGRAAAQTQCRWDGTAPFCEGACGGGETEFSRFASLPSWFRPPAGESVPGFGQDCWTGSKALCCKMRNSSCRWDGSAPFCRGQCLPSEHQTQPPDGSSAGRDCTTGSKVYCCHDTGNANVGSTGLRLEADPKFTRYAAVWEMDASPAGRQRLGTKLSPGARAGGLVAEPKPNAPSSVQPSPRMAPGTRVSPGLQMGSGSASAVASGALAGLKGPLISGARAADLAQWKVTPAPVPWQARHGLTASDYQATFDALTRQGYRLIDVAGYAVGDEDRYAAIWEKSPGPTWQARHGLTAAQYQQEFDRLTGQGYRLVHVSGYAVGNQDHYAAIWEQRQGPAWVARHNLSAAEYQQEFDRLTGQGYRLLDVSGYEVGGQDRYAAIWEQSPGPAWEAHHGMTSAEYQQRFNALAQRGYRVKRLSAWPSGDAAHFAAVWEKVDGPPWIARHGMLADDYQEEFDALGKQGFRLRTVCGYYVQD